MFVVVDKIGWLSLELDESFGVQPIREINVPIFARVDKSIDSFVQRDGKVFNIFRKVICIFQWKSDKVTANDFGLEIGSNQVSTLLSAVRCTGCRNEWLDPLEDAHGDQVSSKG